MLALLALFAESASIEGRWTNPSGSVTVAIAPCGEVYCGTVVAASDKARADAAKGGTPALIGTRLMTDFATAGDGRWRGRLFVPDLNFHAHATLTLEGPATLKVRGCSVRGLLCKSQRWTRAD